MNEREQKTAPAGTTFTVGFFNGARWPIQLVISKLNLTLTLEPGKYILDRQGRKINDPYFEVYVTNKQLQRETSDVPVLLIVVPQVTAPAAPSAQQTNPVRAITDWKRDSRGIRQPVINQPAPVPQHVPKQLAAAPTSQPLPEAVIASATESVRPMSMDEARRLGFARRIREIPEDYGVNDTTGLPPSGIPRIKYSMDPSMNKPAPPLNKEMLGMPKDDPNRQARSQIVSQLAQGARITEDVATNPFSNPVVVNAMPNGHVPAAMPVPAIEPEFEPITESELEPVFQEVELNTLPEPVIDEETEPTEMETVSVPAPVALRPRTPQALTPSQPVLRPMTPKNQFTCMACGAPHKFRSQLLMHAKQKHAGRLSAIMAPYPETQV